MARTNRAVELLAVGQPARVVDFDVLSGLGDRASTNFDVPVFEATGRLGGRAGNLGGPDGSRCLVGCSRLRYGQARQREHWGGQDTNDSFHNAPFLSLCVCL